MQEVQDTTQRQERGGHQIYICYKSVLCLSLWQQNGVVKTFRLNFHSQLTIPKKRRRRGDKRSSHDVYTTSYKHMHYKRMCCVIFDWPEKEENYILRQACLVRLYVRACMLDSYRQQLLLCINQWSVFELLAAQTPPQKVTQSLTLQS